MDFEVVLLWFVHSIYNLILYDILIYSIFVRLLVKFANLVSFMING